MKAEELLNKEKPEIKPKKAPIEKILLGEFSYKKKEKVYNKDSQYYGDQFYKLKVKSADNLEPNKVPE
jgi:hypothetical protein